ncbi:MAG: hypothetical protein KAW84_05540 [Thermoplasmata archaeon]|nr:hypothetical protein [Thermoplasmata archaeon]
MPDLRERVEEDRGLLKRIQLLVPGFAGYRRREDIRAADNMLRILIADRLRDLRSKAEKCRASLVETYETKNLEKLGNLLSSFQAVEGKLRHAEQGYSGISPAIRVDVRELNMLYEYDLSLLEGVERMDTELDRLKSETESKEWEAMSSMISGLRTGLEEFETVMDKRMRAITGTGVTD